MTGPSEPASATATTPRWQSVLLVALSSIAFLVSTNGLSITPFLLTMADDLRTDLAAMSVLFTFSNVAWAISALAAGRLSDRLGRKPVILVGMSLTALAAFGTAFAQDYASMAGWRVVMGLSGGTQMPTILAAASDLFPSAGRGKALGWVMTGQSLSLVLGAPLAAYIGSLADWRWAVGTLGCASVLAVVVLSLLLPRPAPRPVPTGPPEAGVGRLIADPRVLTLFASIALERVCYSAVVLFLATYFIATYDLPLQWLAGALVVVALGNLAGNQLGGRLADRLRAKQTFVALTMVANALLALPLLLGAPGVLASIGFGLLYNLANGAVRPSMLWLVSEISRESRGAIMGLNVTVAGFGWLTASALGGWLITTHGFGALGLLAAACGLGSAAFAWLSGRSQLQVAARDPAPSPLGRGLG